MTKRGNPNFHVDSLASTKGGRNTRPKYELSFLVGTGTNLENAAYHCFKATVADFRGKDDRNKQQLACQVGITLCKP